MFIRVKFILLSLLLAASAIVFSYFVIQRYHSRIPILKHISINSVKKLNPDSAGSPSDGLKPESNNPKGTYYNNRVLVLMYHDVNPEPKDPGTLSVANFEKQLELMRDNNFHWISMSQYTDFILHSAPVPDNAVLLTFDDGYESLYIYAYPILQKYQAPATSFLIVNSIDNPEYKGIPKVTWEQVQLMHKNGIEFFSHSFDSHKYMKIDASSPLKIAMLTGPVYQEDLQRKETVEEYELRVTNDLKQANDLLRQKLNIQNNVLSFPYGGYSESLLDICKGLGIDVTLTVKRGINKPGQTNGFRINAGGSDNDPAMLLSLMKHAKSQFNDIQPDENTSTERHYYTLKSLLVLLIAAALWLWSGSRLLAERKRKMNKNLSV